MLSLPVGWDGYLYSWTFSVHDFEPITGRIHQPPPSHQTFQGRGSITLHPSGLPHGPQQGLAEKSIGMHETHQLAVMCDTFHPRKLSWFAKELDDGKYAYSWYEAAQEGAVAEEAAVDGDASGAGLTSHL